MKNRYATTLLFLSSLLVIQPHAEGAPVSAVDLFKTQGAHSFSLSPDGAYLAFIGRNVHERPALFTQNLETGEINSWMGGGYSPSVVDYFWVNPTHLAYQSTNDEGYAGLYTVKRDSPKITKLTNDRNRLFLVDPLINRDSFLVARVLGDASRSRSIPYGFDRIFSEDDAPGSARLAEIEPVKGKTLANLDLYLVQPGGLTRLGAPHPSLFVDSGGKVQITLGKSSVINWVLTPEEEDGDSTVLGARSDFRVLGLDPSGKMALVAGYFGQDQAGVYRYDLTAKALGPMIFSDSEFDLRDTVSLVSDNLGRPVGLRYETDRPRTIWFSPDLQQIQNVIDKQLPERSNTIVALDPARGRFLIESLSDRQPAQIKLLDLEKRSLTTVYDSKPAIDPDAMVPTESLKMTTGDGRVLRGLLTRPRGLEAPYPTVLLLARTPRQPTNWNFDPAAQFLASRGFAVLRVNTRGTPGYGDHFSNDLLGDVAGMMTDIADSIAWTVDQGLVDPKRVAVAGSYFSASATLSVVGAYPELFRCALALDGFLDLNAYLSGGMDRFSAQEFEFISGLRLFYGIDRKAQLDALSPFARIDSIRCPVLIAYDPRTTTSFGSNRDARQMINALEDMGTPVEGFESSIPFGIWIEPEDEDEKEENAADFEALFARIEAFLADHL